MDETNAYVRALDPNVANALRVRRRYPVREPDPRALAASQGRVSFRDVATHKAEQAYNTFTAPGRALQGQLPEEEQVPAAIGISGLMAGARFPTAGQAGLGVFGGPKAKGANLDKLALAQQMEQGKLSPGLIHHRTDWFRGPTGDWRYEIPDWKATVDKRGFNNLINDEDMFVGNVLKHPELYKNYPDLATLPLNRENNPAYGGLYTPEWEGQSARVSLNPIVNSPKKTLLHEIQHGVQHIENPESAGSGPEWLGYLTKEYVINKNRNNDLLKDRATREKIAQFSDAVGHRLYSRQGTEIESRNVEYRSDIHPMSLRPPWVTQDIPTELAINPPREVFLGNSPRAIIEWLMKEKSGEKN